MPPWHHSYDSGNQAHHHHKLGNGGGGYARCHRLLQRQATRNGRVPVVSDS